MRKFFKKMKQRWDCFHEYKLIKINRVNYVPESHIVFIYYTHDAECKLCGKRKYGVSSAWAIEHTVGYKAIRANIGEDMLIESNHPQVAKKGVPKSKTNKLPIADKKDGES